MNKLLHCILSFYVLVVSCGDPEPVNRVNVSIENTDYGGSVEYVCVVGYNYSTGNLKRTCQSNATWSGEAPVCLSKYTMSKYTII